MKKIIFIEPKAPGFNIYSKFLLPRLGTILLATILEQEGYETEVYFEERQKIDWNYISSADLIGISTITATAPRAYAISRRIKKMGIPVVFGGAHPTFIPEEALEHCDYVVRGEGEETLLELIKALETKRPLTEIKGLSFRFDNQLIHNPDRELCQNLDVLPIPKLSLIKGYKPASGFILKSIIPVITSRGCPYHCKFCSVTPMFGRRYRFRSSQLIIDEIKQYPDSHIFFYDDNFAANRKRTKELLKMMIDQNAVPRSWSGQVRISVGDDDEILELMKKTNCDTLYIGIESINPKTLEIYHKNQNLDQIVRGIEKIRKAGIAIHGMFVLGSDEDDIKVIRKTLRFAKRLKLDTVQFMILTPLPGTDVFSVLKATNKIFTYEWDFYDGQHVVYKPARIIPSVLQIEAFRAMRKFYSWKRVIIHFFKGEWENMIIKGYAAVILKKWKKINWDFKEKLKKGIYDQFKREANTSL